MPRSSGPCAGSPTSPVPVIGARGSDDAGPVTTAVRRADAVVVGAGPNGLVAALNLARAGLAVDVYEASDEPGGGCRTAELTLPGFRHDVCSAVHPLLMASPAFRDIDLSAHGVRLSTPAIAFAHPLDGGRAVCVGGSVDEVAASLAQDGRGLHAHLLAPRPRPGQDPARLPRLDALTPGAPAGGRRLRPPRARRRPGTWPGRSAPRRGARSWRAPPRIPCCPSRRRSRASSLASSPRWRTATAGPWSRAAAAPSWTPWWPSSRREAARVETGRLVKRLDDLPSARAVVLDVTPRQLVEMAGDAMPAAYGRALSRYRYGPGVCKVDWALSGPVPWARRGMPADRDRARRRDLRGDRTQRGGGERGPAPGPPLLPGDPALRGRPRAGPRRPAHAVGLLPRPQRVGRRHDRAGSRRRSSGSPPASAT